MAYFTRQAARSGAKPDASATTTTSTPAASRKRTPVVKKRTTPKTAAVRKVDIKARLESAAKKMTGKTKKTKVSTPAKKTAVV